MLKIYYLQCYYGGNNRISNSDTVGNSFMTLVLTKYMCRLCCESHIFRFQYIFFEQLHTTANHMQKLILFLFSVHTQLRTEVKMSNLCNRHVECLCRWWGWTERTLLLSHHLLLCLPYSFHCLCMKPE